MRGPLFSAGAQEVLASLGGRPLIQPDATTCGSAVFVVSRMLDDPAYASTVLRSGDPQATFAEACLVVHRRTNAWTIGGRAQLPWPRRWGTRPDSLARLLGVSGGTERLVVRRTAIVDPGAAGTVYDAVVAAVRAGWPVPLFVGSSALPRHVVLVVGVDGRGLSFYDPSRGALQQRPLKDFVDARLDAAGWPIPWLALVPSSEVQIDPVIEWAHNWLGRTIRRGRLRVSET